MKLFQIESKYICNMFLIETVEYIERYMDIKTSTLLIPIILNFQNIAINFNVL